MADDKIVIRGERATLKSPNGKSIVMPLRTLLEQAVPPQIDSCGMCLPREVRFAYSRSDFLILVCEYPAGPYTVSWIAEDSPAPYGSDATYRNVTISLPYVIVLAAFERDYLSNLNECFFRTAPLMEIDADNELLYPGLLNCSRFMPQDGRPLSWICTQHLNRIAIHQEKDARRRITVGLESRRRCLFDQSFNLSSDYHELSSWYSESRGIDERIATAQRWHDETVKDRFVGLDVPWLKTHLTLKSVVDRMFQNFGAGASGICTSRQLARLMINNSK